SQQQGIPHQEVRVGLRRRRLGLRHRLRRTGPCAFPAWLAPVQVKVLPVTDRAAEYANEISAALDAKGFRMEVDERNEKIGKKIREATLEKVPYMLVVGDRDMENKTVSVRTRSGEDLGAMSLEAFAAKLGEDVATKAIH
ncbi:MAG: hypothetical protein EGQ09_06190, partial [Clostridiales bacterium]|nr:hypothetical protein [Clostridiales bacterium]